MKSRLELFTVLGSILKVEGKPRFVPSSPDHVAACISRLSYGKKVSVTFSEDKTIRSRDQLRYHWVLVGYLAHHTGYTKDEMHDALMRAVFGTKTVKIGALEQQVRKSFADTGNIEKYEAVELINYDLELCRELGIVVPTKEELGY